jgi:hypothetical protein
MSAPSVTARPAVSTPVAAVAAPLVTVAVGLVLGVTQLLHSQVVPFESMGDYVIEGSYALYLLSAIVSVFTLARAHAGLPGWGRLGTIGAVLYGLGHALVSIPVTATFVLADSPAQSLNMLFMPGIAIWLVSLILLAVATFRARLIPRALAVALPATLPLMMAVGDAGPLIEAVLWTVIAVSLAKRR